MVHTAAVNIKKVFYQVVEEFNRKISKFIKVDSLEVNIKEMAYSSIKLFKVEMTLISNGFVVHGLQVI
jgi:hypothetical protein